MKFKPIFSEGWLFMLLTAALISIFSILLIIGFTRLSLIELVISFAVVLGVSLLTLMAIHEWVFKPEIKRVNLIVQKKSKKKGDGHKEMDASHARLFNPWSRLFSDVSSFAKSKEVEIEELKKSEVFRREFVANVSHELKTPLFASQGFIHTLIDGAAADEKVRTRFLNKAAKSLDGLEILVQDLLMLSHIETGEIKMKIEPQDLLSLAQEVMEQFEESAQKKKIKLKVEVPKKKTLALADAKWIRQVLTNLVSNALHHSPEEETVAVKFDVSKKNIEVTVKDNGAGISPEHLPRIFERFYRVDKSRSREQGGTGLGLAIVKHILEGHGTMADVKSEVGRGSEFSFKLERVRGED